jgi:hypothetical protein
VKEYLDGDNWIALWELSDEDLEKERAQVQPNGETYYHWTDKDLKIVKHTAAPSTVPEGREPQEISREAEETLSAEDKT